ncbi:MAG: hypothetical protein U5K70_06370 [Halodesulfurarchaeum sp.]|nr:hypothetical protein [Halodesulfurarchaeum sp.]
MTTERTMVGVHSIDADGRIELDDAVFEESKLERGGNCLVVASPDGGISVMPVTTGFEPKPSGQ